MPKNPRLTPLSKATVNERLLNDSIRHGIGLHRVEAGLKRRVVAILNSADSAVAQRLLLRMQAIAVRGFDTGPYTTARLVEMREEIGGILNDVHGRALATMERDLGEIAKAEAAYQVGALRAAIPVHLAIATPTAAQLVAAVTTFPLQGRVLREWSKRLSAAQVDRIDAAVKMGFVQGRSYVEIGRDIQGQVMEIGRREAANVAGTAVQTLASEARNLTFKANTDLIERWQFVATLDTHTCFLAGTMIATDEGAKRIEDVCVGERVLTHRGRFRAVRAVMRRRYSGPLIDVACGPRSTTATANHPFLVGGAMGDEWRAASDLSCSDALVMLGQGAPQGAHHALGVGALEGHATDAHDIQAARGHEGVLGGIAGADAGMPVRGIDLQHGFAGGQKEIHGVVSDAVLLRERDPEARQAQADVALGKGFPLVAVEACCATESALIAGARNDAERAPTSEALAYGGGAPARLGTVPPEKRTGMERATASRAPAVDGPARFGASGITMGVAGGNREGFAAGSTLLDDAVLDMPQVTGAGTKRIAGIAAELASAGPTPLGGLQAAHGSPPSACGHSAPMLKVAGGVAEFGSRLEPHQGLAAGRAGAFHVVSISRLDTYYVIGVDVFNLEIENDHSYVADGFVVHNCEVCAALDGKTFQVGEGPHPPIHFGPCRCTPVPLLPTWRSLGIPKDELNLETRASMNGQVPAKTTYNAWLRSQPAAVQDEALGATKGALFRRGGLNVSRFSDPAGRIYTIEELRKRDSAAFERANIAG